jgi:hypothetical protein
MTPSVRDAMPVDHWPVGVVLELLGPGRAEQLVEARA